MKSITHNSQLSATQLKKIINSDSSVISEFVEEALNMSEIYNATYDLAKTLISKMEQGFQMLLRIRVLAKL